MLFWILDDPEVSRLEMFPCYRHCVLSTSTILSIQQLARSYYVSAASARSSTYSRSSKV
ncbi:hypothetical protein JMJ77_0001671, partial [Colletotrichum scovillei]